MASRLKWSGIVPIGMTRVGYCWMGELLHYRMFVKWVSIVYVYCSTVLSLVGDGVPGV